MTTALAPPPKSLLGRHRQLAPSASVFVSPICLGALNFGNAWKNVLGECTKEKAFEILEFFYSQGGNFIDTANDYQAEESEQWIGEWMAKTGRRDEFVIATKYSANFRASQRDTMMQSNFGGGGSKSLHLSVEASLRKLQTNYIDLLFVHYWDIATSIPELMQSLNALVKSGKVIYLGISNTPAWVVVKANCYAREHGLRHFSVYQGRWSAAERDFEREIIPMAKHEGMGLAPWGVLGGGYFKAPGQADMEGGRNIPSLITGNETEVSEVLARIAHRKRTSITSVALAYVLHKAPYVFPICGGRKVEHLKENIEALGLELSKEDIAEIETGYDFNVGFPHNFLSGTAGGPSGPQDVHFTKLIGQFDWVTGDSPITPHRE